MRAVSLLLIVTLLAASLPLSATASRRPCCRTQSSCPMKQHHTNGCAIRCGVSAPATPTVAAIRDAMVLPATVALPTPRVLSIAFAESHGTVSGFASPPPTPPPV
jgi:hypothetical protein